MCALGRQFHFSLYEQLFEKSPMPFMLQDESGKILLVNNSAADYFGYSKDEMTRLSIRDLCPDFNEYSLRNEQEIVVKYGYIILGNRFQRSDGKVVHSEISKNHISTSDGENIFLVSILNFGTSKQKNEENQFLYEMADMSNDAIFVISGGNRVLHSNGKACSMLGYSRSELPGTSVSDFKVDENEKSIFSSYINKLSDLKKDMQYAVLKGKDGALIPVEISIKDIMVENENYRISTVRDISKTVRHLMEIEEKNKLLKNEVEEHFKARLFAQMKYELFIKNAPDPIFFIDKKGLNKEVNEALCLLTGYTKEELSKLSFFSLVAPESRVKAKSALRKLFRMGKVSVSIKMINKSGSCYSVDINAAKMEDGIYMGVCKDVSRSVLLEEELMRLNSDLLIRVQEEVAIRQRQEGMLFEQKKLDDMGLLINAIAHQWRQPINALIINIQDIMDTYKNNELTEEYITGFENVSKDLVQTMSQTIDDFRTFFAPHKTGVFFNPTHETVVLIKLLRAQLLERGIICKVMSRSYETGNEWMDEDAMLACNESIIVFGYADDFKQVLMNIIYNAADSIEECFTQGSLTKGLISITIEHTLKEIIISVKDNGTGIKKSALGKVFDPYYTTKEQGKGTGIGLYMAKMVIEKHNGGKIIAYNEDVGAVFKIVIPK